MVGDSNAYVVQKLTQILGTRTQAETPYKCTSIQFFERQLTQTLRANDSKVSPKSTMKCRSLGTRKKEIVFCGGHLFVSGYIPLEKTKIKEDTKIPIMTNSLPINNPQIKDQDGIKKAYDRDSKLYINANTMYVGGTNSVQDVWDDLKIPFFQTDKTLRYKDAKMLLEKNPNINNLIGHSLGGSVVLPLQKDFPERNFNVNTYGAPVMSLKTFHK
mgnify:CR=1 FL=1